MPFRTAKNVSILLKHLPSTENPRQPAHYIHQASASSQAICDLNPDLNDRIFGDLMSDNISTYNFNEADFHLGRVEVVYNLTSNKHGGIDINNLASRLGVGKATALRTLEYTNQLGFRQSNFSLGVICLRS